jgi:hypothetical protein
LKTEVILPDVGTAAPLIFEVTAEIMGMEVGVAEAEDGFEDVGITDEDPDPEDD